MVQVYPSAFIPVKLSSSISSWIRTGQDHLSRRHAFDIFVLRRAILDRKDRKKATATTDVEMADVCSSPLT